MLKIRIKGGIVKRVNQLLMNKLQHTHRVLSTGIVIHKDDVEAAKKVMDRNYVSYSI